MSAPTVLHVDDDGGIRRLSKRRFEQQASDVTLLTAADAEEGLQLLETETVDCLVSDSLTLADGTPFVLAASDRDPDLDVVLFTASEWEDVESLVHEAGVAEYVRKGDGDRLDAVVDYVLDLLAASDAKRMAERTKFDAATNDWEFVTRHEWESPDDLGTAIVRAVESYAGVDADALPPLYESVDAEALEELLEPRASSPGGNVGVRFDYEAYELVVTSDGLILARGRGDYDPDA
ncbi:HalOD1 output domain-containing protein [Haloplanus sp. GCM10025708]|uniref:HalOD1 output domain-containing protein n=1 Tax=Haloferacaceae TaxID=1644056 RepID=UPI00360EA356